MPQRSLYGVDMSKRTDGSLPLPSGWEVGYDFDGKMFYIDHKNKTTSWVDPRDRVTKPQSFADCVGDELPFGWEECYDPNVGVYYINHNTQVNQLEDPRYEWRRQQERMLTEYLCTAHEELAVKREIAIVKQEQLNLAQDEFRNLNESLANWKSSRISLNSTSSVASSAKHDPDLLRTEVALAKTRVSRLKRELDQIQMEMRLKEDGLKTLEQVNEKMAGQHYTISEATAILNEIYKIKLSLMSGEKEKKELMESLARLKDDFLVGKFQEEAALDAYSSIDRCSAASQTDLTTEFISVNARVTEMSRVRAEYDEARKKLTELQKTLARLEDSSVPGQKESDRDRLLLIQEKEQLLRELRALSLKEKDEREATDVLRRIERLQGDLSRAAELSSRQISDRLRQQEDRHDVIRQLAEAARHATRLETQLRCLSMGSLSSSSSLGSLSSLGGSSLPSSSRGSLNSSSYSDLYAQSSRASSETSLPDLHRRVEKLLQGQMTGVAAVAALAATPQAGSSFPERSDMQSKASGYQGSVAASTAVAAGGAAVPLASAFPPPTYEQHMNGLGRLRVRGGGGSSGGSGSASSTAFDPAAAANARQQLDEAQLHTRLSELMLLPAQQAQQLQHQLDYHAAVAAGLVPAFERQSSAGTLPCHVTGVSAAVSDESVAGDSGVFEGSMQSRLGSDGQYIGHAASHGDGCAQVQVKLCYDVSDGCLHVGVERARNLGILSPSPHSRICIKASILPVIPNVESHFSTTHSADLDSPKFSEDFAVRLAEGKVASKTLSINIMSFFPTTHYEDCLGCVQVSLADFDITRACSRWYNVLSIKLTQAGGAVGVAAAAAPASHQSTPGFRSLSPEGSGRPLQLLSRVDGSQGARPGEPSNGLATTHVKAPRTTAHTFSDTAVVASSSSQVALTLRSGGAASAPLLATTAPTACDSGSTVLFIEESSDESSIVSGSQASTLTRMQGTAAAAALSDEACCAGFQVPNYKEGTPAESVTSLCSDCASSSLGSDVTDGGGFGGQDFTCFDSSAQSGDDLLSLSDGLSDGAGIHHTAGDAESATVGQHVAGAAGNAAVAEAAASAAVTSAHAHSSSAMAAVRGTSTGLDADGSAMIRRSQTFSTTGAIPVPQLGSRDQYVCRLNRSDSDSSMHRRTTGTTTGPFLRGTYERRSLRFKQQQQQSGRSGGSGALRGRLLQPTAAPRKITTSQLPRTSIDLELDLQASHFKLSQQQEEINRLKELKKRLEEAIAKGDKELPEWFSDEQLQKLLASADKVAGKSEPLSHEDVKIEKLVHKLLKQADKYRRLHKRDADLNTFREKMAFFTTRRTIAVPSVMDCERNDGGGSADGGAGCAVAASDDECDSGSEVPRWRPLGTGGSLAGKYDTDSAPPQPSGGGIPSLNFQQLLEIAEEEEML